MFLFSLFRKRPLVPRRARTARTQSPTPFRPCLEGLEDRLVPALLTVTNPLGDASPGTLRAALATANADAANGISDTITFDQSLAGATISVAGQGSLELSGAGGGKITIDGSGLSTPVTISGANGTIRYTAHVFQVDLGVVAEFDGIAITRGFFDGGDILTSGTLTLDGCTVADSLNGGGTYGGGIENLGDLTILNSTLSHNNSNYAGAIDNAPGAHLIMSNSVVSDNYGYIAGGIMNYGWAQISDCTFSNNNSIAIVPVEYVEDPRQIDDFPFQTDWGADIVNTSAGQLQMTNCQLLGYTSLSSSIQNFGALIMNGGIITGYRGLEGGGITNVMGTLTMNGVTVSGNTAADGGGIYNWAGTVSLDNCTLTDNTANRGGAIATFDGQLDLKRCDVKLNTAYTDGGGLFIDPAVVTIQDCTFADNTVQTGSGTDVYNLESTVTILGGTVSGVYNNGGTVLSIDTLKTQVAALDLNSGQQNSLFSILQAAEDSLMNANTTAAINQLSAFINKVNGLMNSRRLDEITGDSLVSEVEDLSSYLM